MTQDTISQVTHKKIDDALKRLKESGFKNTKKRQEILEIFAHNDRYLSAQEIHEQLAEIYPTMSYNTTYRNIYDFCESGILESTEYNQEQRFRMNCLNHDHHHHHFICTECGMAIPIDACPMETVSFLGALKDVEVQSHRFEIFGLCATCK